MITLHHLENSQSIKILWLLEELGLDYEFKMYDREPTLLAPKEYKAISPLGTAPAITDGDLALSESNAIIDYILDRYGEGRLRPAVGAPEHVKYLFWFHAAQGSIQPLTTMNFVHGVVVDRMPFLFRPILRMALGGLAKNMIDPRLDAALAVMERDLASSDWLAGDALTAADIAMCYGTHSLESAGAFQGRLPRCQAYAERMRAHPSYQRALAKDGKYTGTPQPA